MSQIDLAHNGLLALDRVISAYKALPKVEMIEVAIADEPNEDSSVILVLDNSVVIQSHPDREIVEYLAIDGETDEEFKYKNYEEALEKVKKYS